MFRIELAKFFFRLKFYPLSRSPDLIGKPATVFRNVLKHDFVEQDGDRVEIRGEGVCTNAQSFQRNRSATGKWVYYERTSPGHTAQSFVRGFGERAAAVEVFTDDRVVPIGEVCDEIEQCAAQLKPVFKKRGILPSGLKPLTTFVAEKLLPIVRGPREHFGKRHVAKCDRTERIHRVRPERSTNHRTAGR